MWIFQNNSFVSVVQDKHLRDQVWVRARVRGDVEAFFAKTDFEPEVIETQQADYRFRAAVSKADVAAAVSQSIMNLDYENFKNSVPKGAAGDMRHDAYTQVWSEMFAYQRRAANK
jgi:hypothetical protein